MTGLLDRMNTRVLAAAVAVFLVAACLVLMAGSGHDRTVTAHFSRAVAIYKGSEVRLMGVPIGTVTAVVPEGNSVRVEMKYDAQYTLPAGAKAAIVTPTLVADRFVQLAPAYSGGKVLGDRADIPLTSTGTPVELDRIYKSLADLSDALGPNGANKTGALSSVLSSGANALRGRGALANRTILSLSQAVQAFGDNSGALFDSVRQLSELTVVLARNDQFVNSFMSNLAGVSAQLADQRGDLRLALVSLSRVVKVVRGFVHDNRVSLTSNVKGLTNVLGTVAKEQDALGTALQLAPLGLGNLATGFDHKTGSEGSRIQFGPTVTNLGNVLCDIVVNARIPNAQLACKILKVVTAPLAQNGNRSVPVTATGSRLGSSTPSTGLGGLLGVS